MDLESVADTIRRGGVAIYPTDTLYGLGADATDGDAVKRVYGVKGRPPDRPVSVATTPDRVPEVAYAGGFEDLLGTLLPGPLTLLLPAKDLPGLLVSEGKVGVRVPDDEVAQALLELTPPLTSTSANRSGEDPAHTPGEAEGLLAEVDAVVDDGPRRGDPSTVYDAVDRRVVREGPISAEEVETHLD